MRVRPISFRLGVLVVLVAGPLLVLAIGLLLWSAALSRHTVDRALREAVRMLAIAVEQEIAISAAALHALAATPRPECEPTRGFYEQARTVATRYGGWVVLADAEGKQRMNTLRPLGDDLPRASCVPLAPGAAGSERPFVSDVVVAPLVGRLVLYIAAPLAGPGEPPCWLSMGFGPERFASLVRPPGSRSSWSGILTDARDLLIIPSSDEKAPAGSPAPEWYVAATGGRERGLADGEWFGQGPVRIAFQRVNGGRWTVGVAAPLSEYYFAWAAPVALGTLGSLLVICSAVLVARGYARRMKREVDRLVAQAARLGEGLPPAPTGAATVAELAALEKMLERADGDIRGKDVFLATLSHELRGPLTAVIGWLDIARGSLEDRNTLRRALGTASRNARQQARIIDDLLDMSRILSGKFPVDRRPMDLGRLVREALEAARLDAAEKALELRCSVLTPALVLGDRQRLHQALGNLIGNAIKFSRVGGWVEVAVERGGDNLRLIVADNGSGISRDALPHIFERFWQAPGARRGHGGLGLGLPLVRHIVEAHEGHVLAESAGAGRGARFIVELPALAPSQTAAVPAEQARSTEAGDSRLEGLAVLAVDDDDMLGWLQMALARHGAATWCARSAEEGLRLFRRVRPDLLISELRLPDRDGYALIRGVRERAGTGIGALAHSGEATQEARERALAEGYDAFLAKPCDTETLIATLAGLAQKRSWHREAK
jgi:signal transduction histidine kinase/CheY-like chemotaxis protein